MRDSPSNVGTGLSFTFEEREKHSKRFQKASIMLAVHEPTASAWRDSLVMSHAAATAAACIVPCLSVKAKMMQGCARCDFNVWDIRKMKNVLPSQTDADSRNERLARPGKALWWQRKPADTISRNPCSSLHIAGNAQDKVCALE